ncbi:hypothetical protein PENSOL_c117G01555 [Penicillium solitum]|uniref:Uncharacterized protein n=1 Tax=Penicillium solitum TaxID=60172 RepID=A0A1V6Q6C0_9EURO|nr:hypothetical protein PENSOL_c117G01555 [Penicillium solitum]
MLIALSRND